MVTGEDFYEITCEPAVYTEVHEALTKAGYEMAESDIEYVPSMESNPTDNAVIKQLRKMIDALEDNDDVQKVHTNCGIDLWEEE